MHIHSIRYCNKQLESERREEERPEAQARLAVDDRRRLAPDQKAEKDITST